MADIAKLGLALLLIVLLLRRKAKVGYVLMTGSALLALLYLMRPSEILSTARKAALDPVTIKLALALTLIRVFEMVLREREVMQAMMSAFRGAFRNVRAVLVSMPLLIGMLPSIGGAYFSAPMVKEASRGLEMKAEEKAFVNYWFRHPWEYILPLYPGVLLASALSGMPLRSLILANLACAAFMIISGFMVSMKQASGSHEPSAVTLKGFFSFIPLAGVLVMVIAFGLRLDIALGIALVALFAHYRYGLRDIWRAVRYGLSEEVLVLIAGVMLFKGMMEATGAVGNISAFFVQEGIPLLPTLVLLPFIAGLLMGLTIGFVGSTFPLLMSLPGGDTLGAVALAFASGFVGVLLSPVHVCLILTREYFHASMPGIYRYMLPPALGLIGVGVAMYYILGLMGV